MAVRDFTGFEGGESNQKWNPVMMTFGPRNPASFKEVDAALLRIAEAAARAGTVDDADWSEVHAAICEAHQLIDELS